MITWIFVFNLIFQYSFSKVVLIDPGHGGDELGAVGIVNKKKVFEKDLSLRLAEKIKKHLESKATVFLTRSFDKTLGLQARADLADLANADLFVSIHFNSSSNPKSHGFELYYLDNSKDQAVNKLEKIENQGLKGEELIINQILVDLVIRQTEKHSKSLAKSVHQNLLPILKKFKISDRGIKPGLFYVLALSKRPGILIEAGFLSNPKELNKIQSDEYLNSIAKAIAQGIAEHKII